jgi:acyl carrier protein
MEKGKVMEDLIKEIKQRLVDNLQLHRSADEIDTDAPLFENGLGLDSLDVLELVVMLDRFYGIKSSIWMKARKPSFPSGASPNTLLRKKRPDEKGSCCHGCGRGFRGGAVLRGNLGHLKSGSGRFNAFHASFHG